MSSKNPVLFLISGFVIAQVFMPLLNYFFRIREFYLLNFIEPSVHLKLKSRYHLASISHVRVCVILF